MVDVGSLDDIKMDAVRTTVSYVVTNMPHWVRVTGTACDDTLGTFHKVRYTSLCHDVKGVVSCVCVVRCELRVPGARGALV